MTDKPGGVRRR